MTQPASSFAPALDYGATIIGASELSGKSWVLAVQLPGVKRHSKHVLEPRCEDLVALIERLKARSSAAGHKIERVILTHEAGQDGFWLARFLKQRGIGVHVMQPSSVPVDRRARRAKTDAIDVEIHHARDILAKDSKAYLFLVDYARPNQSSSRARRSRQWDVPPTVDQGRARGRGTQGWREACRSWIA